MGKKQPKSDIRLYNRISFISGMELGCVLVAAFAFVAYLFTLEVRTELIDGEYWDVTYHYPVCLWIGGVCAGLGFIFGIVDFLVILCSKFQCQWAAKISNKLIFGLIGLLLVGPVMYIIYASIAKKKYLKQQQEPLPAKEQYKGNPFGSSQESNQAPQSNPFGGQ